MSADHQGFQAPPSSSAFQLANIGRDQSIYQGALNAADWNKAQEIISHLEVPEGGVIKDIGSGTGRVAEIVARHFSRSTVYGVDLSHELLEVSERERVLMQPVYGNACEQLFPANAIDAAYSSTCFHEIASFQGTEGVQKALHAVYQELVPGGVLVLRDMVQPTDQEEVLLEISLDDGVGTGSAVGDDFEAMSTLELFRAFHRDFEGGESFEYKELEIDDRTFVRVSPRIAYEFYMRKDYRRNYRNEINETYGPWTKETAIEYLRDAGFTHIEVHDEYNSWILENRLKGKVALYRQAESGQLEHVPFYPTHLTLVARKPSSVRVQKSKREFSLFDARKALNEIELDVEQGILKVAGREFSFLPQSVLQGTKRMVVHSADNPDVVIKIPRVNGQNAHNSFKAMYQTIERQGVLEEYGVPHLRVVDFDSSGPPYHYLMQEKLPLNAVCAADLILTDQLTQRDVEQVASIVNRCELEKKWQLDTNPYNWYRVTLDDGMTEMTYVDGKVYLYDDRWAFNRKGLLQWLEPSFLPGYSDSVVENCAQIPTEVYTDRSDLWWDRSRREVQWWAKYLDKSLLP